MSLRKSIYAWVICLLGALFYCYEYLLRVYPSIISEELIKYFNIDIATFGQLVAFYYYAYDPMQLPVGVIVDRYPPKFVITIAVLTCAFGFYLFTSHDLLVAQIGRLLTGFGSAFGFVGALKLITLFLPRNRFAFAAGSVMLLGMLAAMGSDILLSYWLRLENWVELGRIIALIGISLAILLFLFIPKQATETTYQQPNSLVKIYKELLSIIKNPIFLLIGMMGCLLYLPISAFAELWAVPYLRQEYHLSIPDASTVASMIFLGMGLGGPLIGWLSDKLEKRCLIIMFSSIASALILVLILYTNHLATTSLKFLFFLIGGFTSAQMLVFVLAKEKVPLELAGTAMAVTNMMVMFSGVVFQPLIGYILQLTSHSRLHFLYDFKLSLSLIPACVLLGGLLACFIQDSL